MHCLRPLFISMNNDSFWNDPIVTWKNVTDCLKWMNSGTLDLIIISIFRWWCFSYKLFYPTLTWMCILCLSLLSSPVMAPNLCMESSKMACYSILCIKDHAVSHQWSWTGYRGMPVLNASDVTSFCLVEGFSTHFSAIWSRRAKDFYRGL